MSFLYLLLLGVFGGLSTDCAFQIIRGEDAGGQWRLTAPSFLWGAAVWVTLGLLVQLHRIGASLRRCRTHEPTPPHALWNLQVGMQFKCLLLLIAVPGLPWLVTWIVGWLRG